VNRSLELLSRHRWQLLHRGAIIGAPRPNGYYGAYDPGYYDQGYISAPPYVGGEEIAYCQQRFMSYDPASRHLPRIRRLAPSMPMRMGHLCPALSTRWETENAL
jgi:hypothetical protein